MDIRKLVLDAFPETLKHEFKIFHLASVLWKPHVADKLRNVGEWQQLLDMPVDKIGPTGIGALMNFMDADMLVAYLPAWMVIAYEHEYSYAGVLPALAGALDYEFNRLKRNASKTDFECGNMSAEEINEEFDDLNRFKDIKAYLTTEQMETIAEVFDELAYVHLPNDQEVKQHLLGVSAYWRHEAQLKYQSKRALDPI